MAQKQSRRAGRELAFQVLYGLHFNEAPDVESLRQAFEACPDPEAEAPRPAEGAERPGAGFAWELVHGVWSATPELDAYVRRLSQHWRVERIARVELTILRLALYEIIHRPDIPIKVVINEAVELAKQFGDDQSSGFVNGILDAAARAMEEGALIAP